MLEATARAETHVPPLHCFPQTSANRETRAAPELRILDVAGDKADGGPAAHLLLVGDGATRVRELVRRAFPTPASRVEVADAGDLERANVRGDGPDVVLLGMAASGSCGPDVYEQIRRIIARVPVIFVARQERADAAIEAMKHGAFDCLFHPIDPSQLRRVVGAALEVAHRMRQPAEAEEAEADPGVESAMIGSCAAMAEVYKAVGRVAAQDVPVLITGESGTGKELVARALHRHGPRAAAPFLALNCAAIPEQLLESELFGHERGAFTGADRRRIGKFEQCHGGTIFLDEVGDMPLSLQAKVLRLLQEQAFERVGGNETIRTDVRIIAATHRDLKVWSAEGRFRPDLYYRLGVFTIHLPSLRERGDDLPLLVRHYLRRFSRELGREVRHIAPEALDRLRAHSWPGNIRELQSVLKQALLQATGATLLPAFLPEGLGTRGEAAAPTTRPAQAGADTFVVRQRLAPDMRELYSEAHRQLDQVLLPQVLTYTRGNQQRAALLLGIARQTLRSKMRQLVVG